MRVKVKVSVQVRVDEGAGMGLSCLDGGTKRLDGRTLAAEAEGPPYIIREGKLLEAKTLVRVISGKY